MREFEVRYREQRALSFGEAVEAQTPVQNSSSGLTPVGPILINRVSAEVEQEARAVFAGFFIISIKDLGPMIEAGQQWFKLEQAAKYCGVSKTTFQDYVLTPGRLTRPGNGDPIFSRKDLDRIAAEGIGKAKGKKKIKFREAA
jgi:hypothetical protein